MALDSDISLNSYICPLCHCGRFGPHHQIEYSREWQKCPTCGYMELQETTRNRILSRLAPDQLKEPFIDPLTPEIRNQAGNMMIYRESVEQNDDTTDHSNSSSRDENN